jgi:putative addiction module component (TIGR02574 family)
MVSNLELEKLTVTERLQLIGELWDSIDAEEQPELTKAQKDELERRLAAYAQDGNKGKPWSEIESRVKQR